MACAMLEAMTNAMRLNLASSRASRSESSSSSSSSRGRRGRGGARRRFLLGMGGSGGSKALITGGRVLGKGHAMNHGQEGFGGDRVHATKRNDGIGVMRQEVGNQRVLDNGGPPPDDALGQVGGVHGG